MNRSELFKILLAVSYSDCWSVVVLLPTKSLTPCRLTTLAMALHAIWIELIVPSKSAWSGLDRVASIMKRDSVMMLWCLFGATVGGCGSELRSDEEEEEEAMSRRTCTLLYLCSDAGARRSVHTLRHSRNTSALTMVRCMLLRPCTMRSGAANSKRESDDGGYVVRTREERRRDLDFFVQLKFLFRALLAFISEKKEKRRQKCRSQS